jgi:hypothetical protein
MIQEPKKRKRQHMFLYILSFVFGVVFVGLVAFAISFSINILKKPFEEINPTTSFETLDQNAVKTLLSQ